jgi:hypothetical protein
VKSGDIESTLPKNERVGPISICNGEEQQKKEGSIPKHDNDDDDDARVLFQIWYSIAQLYDAPSVKTDSWCAQFLLKARGHDAPFVSLAFLAF